MAIVPLSRADARCGAKAMRLAMLLRSGFRVPDGFVVTDARYSDLAAALAELGPGPYAVRSSALEEDGAATSYAGQFHTSLDVPSRDVAAAIRRTAASAEQSAPRAYVARAGTAGPGAAGASPDAAGPDAVPALIQPMVRATVTGVLFTRDPVSGAGHTLIEAAHGTDVVDGATTPERWVVTSGEATRPQAGAERLLGEEQALGSAALGAEVAKLFGAPQDIEWAIADDKIWLLQARPITTGRVTAPTPTVTKTRDDPAPAVVPLLTGTGAGPGTATAPPGVVRGLDDFGRFTAGDVLVCASTSPAWTPLLARAAAVVTETGGILSHAAIVAREFGIPAVVGAAGAMDALDRPGPVIVDGTHGTVTREDR